MHSKSSDVNSSKEMRGNTVKSGEKRLKTRGRFPLKSKHGKFAAIRVMLQQDAGGL